MTRAMASDAVPLLPRDAGRVTARHVATARDETMPRWMATYLLPLLPPGALREAWHARLNDITVEPERCGSIRLGQSMGLRGGGGKDRVRTRDDPDGPRDAAATTEVKKAKARAAHHSCSAATHTATGEASWHRLPDPCSQGVVVDTGTHEDTATQECTLFPLEWEADDGASCSTSRTDILKAVLDEGLQYHPGGGLLQAACPSALERSALITAISKEKLWRFSGGGDDSGVGARSWTYSLMRVVDVDGLRQLARAQPLFARLLQLHDSVQKIAKELEGPDEPATTDARKGPAGRKEDALQNMWIRLCLPKRSGRKPMTLGFHRDLHGESAMRHCARARTHPHAHTHTPVPTTQPRPLHPST